MEKFIRFLNSVVMVLDYLLCPLANYRAARWLREDDRRRED